MKSFYIRRFRPGRRFTEKLDPNLTHAGGIPAEQPESIGKTRFIKYKIILKLNTKIILSLILIPCKNYIIYL